MTIIKNETTVPRPQSPAQVFLPAQLGGPIEAGPITNQPLPGIHASQNSERSHGYLNTCLVKAYCFPMCDDHPNVQTSLRVLTPVFSGMGTLTAVDLSLGITAAFGSGTVAGYGIVGTTIASCIAGAVIAPPVLSSIIYTAKKCQPQR